jgi:hypothetical protein
MFEKPITKSCIACQAEIPAKASICSHCSTRQNRLSNNLQGAGTMVGVISAVLAFASYIISSAPAVRQTLWWTDDVNILAYSDETAVIGNNGDGEVFVSHILIESDQYGSSIQEINKPIEVGDILTFDFPFTDDPYLVISDVSDAEWDEYFQNALEGTDTVDGECIGIFFFSENAPALRLYTNALGDSLKKIDAIATVFYYSNKKGVELSKQFPVYGILGNFEKSCTEVNP